jgi:hypothetical protein
MPVGRSATSLLMKSSTLGALGFLQHRKRFTLATGRAQRPTDPSERVGQRSGAGRHHDIGFRLTVIRDHQPALAQVSILFSWVLERISKGVAAHIPRYPQTRVVTQTDHNT